VPSFYGALVQALQVAHQQGWDDGAEAMAMKHQVCTVTSQE
jgi:hypothetical protein